jgi:Concanavalin A-like lectin/glucanases superfamily
VTYNGSTATLFVNGQQDTTSGTVTLATNTGSGTHSRIGAWVGGGVPAPATVDDVRVYSSALTAAQIAAIAAPPTIATAATASVSSSGTTAALSVLGSDPLGESTLTYTWSTVSKPSGAPAPTFSANDSNSAKSTTATLGMAGSYSFQVSAVNTANESVVSTVTITIAQISNGLEINTPLPMVAGTSQQLSSIAVDQFGVSLATQPAITWTVSGAGGGAVNSSGSYSSSSSGNGTETVTVTSGTFSSTASIAVVPGSGVLSINAIGTQTVEPGAPFTLALANIYDTNPSANLANFTASIDWGDGTSSSAGTFNSGSSAEFVG